jgi:predicted ATPase
MKIKRIWAKGLYGYLSFEILAKDGLNILVGINGSGKTSALNVVNWLTTPHIANLATTAYDEIGIEFKVNPVQGSTTTKLWAIQGEKSLDIHCSQGKRMFSPINVRFTSHPKNLINDKEARQKALEGYHTLSPEKSEVELWSFLEEIAKPLTITLDRTISIRKKRSTSTEDTSEDYFLLNHRFRHISLDPITQIEILARERHSKYKSELIKLNEKLKSNIIASTFSRKSSRTKLSTIKQINEIESKLLNQINAWTAESQDATSISQYFDKIRKIVNTLGGENRKNIPAILTNLLTDDMQRISALSDAFESFETSSSEILKPIKTYLDILNSFLSDSKKTLYFDDQTSDLQFRANNSSSDARSIELMSSGEKQVLILLTLVAFPPDSTTTFVIDEPEISLHPKWQHQLLPSITALMSKNAQMIIATHSPELVGNFREHCIGV